MYSRLLPLLAVTAPLCSSFAPSTPSSITRAHVLHAESNSIENDNEREVDNVLERVGKVAGSAFVALTLGLSTINAPADAYDSAVMSSGPSITIASRKTSSDDDVLIKALEKETREVEKEAKNDAKKVKVEKSREAFFEYEAKMAAQQEARIEAAEKKAELEAEKDKEEAEALKALEQKAEREAALAMTKKEKAAKQKEAKELLKKEREAERKERRAERAERIYLAEEQTEQKILKQKADAALEEEKKFEEVEKKYETVAELAKEDELELKLAKDLLRKK